MKIVKPSRIGLLKRSIPWGGRTMLSVGLVIAFPLSHPRRLLEEGEMWERLPPVLGDQPLDTGEPKARGEVVVFGDYHAPGGSPVLQHGARVAVGPIDKSIRITGAREWAFDKENRLIVTQPQPFAAMKLDWRLAFGGANFPDNPTGRGHVLPNAASPDGRYPLPCLEYPHDVVKAPGDVVAPAGFGPRDIMLPARQRFAGTYDRFWAENHAPGLAADARLDLFQVAAPDQQIDGFFSGTEAIAIEHMHPDRPQILSRLPAIRPRLFLRTLKERGSLTALSDDDRKRLLQRTGKEQDVLLWEHELRADTVVLFPALDLGVMIHRAHLWVSAFDHPEIDLLLAAFEWQEDAPRSRAYYGDDLVRRLDPDDGFKLGLDYTSLSPEGWRDPPQEKAAWLKVMAPRDPTLPPRLQAKLDEANAQLRATMPAEMAHAFDEAAAGRINPAESEKVKALRAEIAAFRTTAAKATDGNALRPQLDRMMAMAREIATDAMTAGEAKARALSSRFGVDYDKLVADAAAKRTSPKAAIAQADAEVARIAAQAPPALRDKLLANMPGQQLGFMDQAMGDIGMLQASMQSRMGHLMPPPSPPSAPEAERRVTALKAQLADAGDLTRGQFAGLDLTGFDFSHHDLTEADFTGCRLNGARFNGATLTRCCLALAVLDDARFNGALLSETNLGKTSLNRTDFSGATFDRGAMGEAAGHGTAFVDATLTGVVFEKVRLQAPCFIDTRMTKVTFLDCELGEAVFDRAQLDRVTMVDCRADLACFAQSKMTRVSLVNCRMQHADFSRATVDRLSTAGKMDLTRARFDRAKMTGACFIGAQMPNTSWTATNLSSALFNQADLRQAHFTAALAANASFMRADLSEADLQGSDLAGASLIRTDLRRARLADVSLYGADLTDTLLENAILDRSLIDMTKLAGPNYP